MKAVQDFGRKIADTETMTLLGSIQSDQAAQFRDRTVYSTFGGIVEKVFRNKAFLHQCGQTYMKRKPKKELNIPFWNVRTMHDKAKSSRSRRLSILIAHEISRLDVDVVALSEVRLTVESSLHDLGAGLSLFWSGIASVTVAFPV